MQTVPETLRPLQFNRRSVLQSASSDTHKVLDYMVCHPVHQRKGVASLLLERGEAEARKLGLKIFVMTATDPAGTRFYESSGFKNLRTVTLDGMLPKVCLTCHELCC